MFAASAPAAALNLQSAAALLRVSPGTLRHALATCDIPHCCDDNGQFLFDRQQLLTWLSSGPAAWTPHAA